MEQFTFGYVTSWCFSAASGSWETKHAVLHKMNVTENTENLCGKDIQITINNFIVCTVCGTIKNDELPLGAGSSCGKEILRKRKHIIFLQ